MRPDAHRPVIIIGVGRSGTSLFQSMLHAHPEVTFLPETQFFRKYVARPISRWRWQRKGAVAFTDELNKDAAFGRAEIDPHCLLRPYIDGERAFKLRDVYRRLLTLARRRTAGTQIAGDKDPRIIDYLTALRAALSTARVLHVIRDPRDVLASRMRAAWSADRAWWLHVLIYRAQLTTGRRAGRRLFGSAYREVLYERLLEDPESELRDICNFLGIQFKPGMLQFQEAARDLVDDSESSWKSNTMRPILRNNRNKWREALTSRQVMWVEQICTDPFRTLPYTRLGPQRKGNQRYDFLARWFSLMGGIFEAMYGIRKQFS